MPKCFLHVGLPKTGTSQLQRFFALNSAVLESCGVSYPELFDLTPIRNTNYGQGNGYSLAYSLMPNKSATICNYPEFTISDLAVHLERATHDLLISSEWFNALQKDTFAELVETIKKTHHLVVVVYLRPALDAAESHISQKIKMGHVFSIDQLAPTLIRMKGAFLKYFQLSNQLGYRVIIRPYSQQHWTSNNICTDFITNVLNISGEHAWELPTRTNESLHPVLLTLVKALTDCKIKVKESELLKIQELISSKNSELQPLAYRWVSDKHIKDASEVLQSYEELSNKLFPNINFSLASYKKADNPHYAELALDEQAHSLFSEILNNKDVKKILPDTFKQLLKRQKDITRAIGVPS